MDVSRPSTTPEISIRAALAVNERTAQNRELMRAVNAVNRARYFGPSQELVFVLDPDTRRPIMRLIDSGTKEVIRQIPPEYILEIAKDLERWTRA